MTSEEKDAKIEQLEKQLAGAHEYCRRLENEAAISDKRIREDEAFIRTVYDTIQKLSRAATERNTN